MHQELKSLLWGAMVAALLIVPTLAHSEPSGLPDPSTDIGATVASAGAEARAAAADARRQARAAAAEARRSVENARTIVLAEAGRNDGTGDWTTRPEKRFEAHGLHIEDVIGTVRIAVRQGGPMTVKVSGTPAAVQALDVNLTDGMLEVEGARERSSVWDWRHWFDFSNLGHGDRSKLQVEITVPRGAPVTIDDLIGNVTIGDLDGPLQLEATATKARIGKISRAHIEMNGSGRIDIAEVTGELHLEIAGSGKVTSGPVGKLNADLAGSGDAIVGDIHGGLDLDIAGSGSLTATKVNGPMKVSIAGAGAVKIAEGLADPFHVDIMGSGDVVFGGTAVNPKISALGSGSVKLKAYRGHLDSEGMANVKIGE